MGVAAYKMVAPGYPTCPPTSSIVSKKLWKMEEPFCKTQSNPVVAPWSFLGDQFVDSLLWMKFLLKISQAILAYLKFLHLVHLAIGFHKVSSNRSSQIDWTEVVGIAFFWTGAGFKILEALKTLRSSPPQNPHGRLIFFWCSNIFTFVDVFINSPYPSTKWYSKSSTKWRCLTLAYDLVLI